MIHSEQEITNPEQRERWLSGTVILLILVVLGATILVLMTFLRARVREQIVARDGEILHAVALMQQLTEAETDPQYSIEDPASQLALLLQTSRLKGVVGARLYDGSGQFVTSFPEYVTDGKLPSSDLGELDRIQPVSRFNAHADLTREFIAVPQALSDQSKDAPLLQVLVPLHRKDQTKLYGVAEFLIEGRTIAAEFANLERFLRLQAAVIFLVGGFIIVFGVSWAFRRLQQANRRLAEQSASLLRANQELALAAKTSAVGAITAHLMHGLKSPLFGLQSIVSSQFSQQKGAVVDTAWQTALDTTHHMQGMINKVFAILQEERGMSDRAVTLSTIAESIQSAVLPIAQTAGVRFAVKLDAAGSVEAPVANLVILVLTNLIDNAVAATPKEGTVTLAFSCSDDNVFCEVSDEGAGLPPQLKNRLFTPCTSTKKGGSGIGLSISKQLANHLGAELLLKSSSASGTVFVFMLPRELFIQ